MRVAAVASLRGVTMVEKNVLRFSTQDRYREDVQTLVQAIRTVVTGRVRGMCVAVAGRVDRERGRVVRSPNIPSWDGKPLVADLRKAFGCPVVLENDAVCAALGEATYGTTKGDFVFLTWGTGIGGAWVWRRSGRLIVAAAEPGHQRIMCAGMRALITLEQCASGDALRRRFGKASDALTIREWAEVLDGMEVGMTNALTVWCVPTVVFGGGIGVHHPERVRALHRQMRRHRDQYPMLRIPAFRLAAGGDAAGIWGAFARLALSDRQMIVL